MFPQFPFNIVAQPSFHLAKPPIFLLGNESFGEGLIVIASNIAKLPAEFIVVVSCN